MALCGGTVLEDALFLSSDRLLNEWSFHLLLILDTINSGGLG